MQANFFETQQEKVTFLAGIISQFGDLTGEGCGLTEYLEWTRVIDKQTKRTQGLNSFTLDKLPDIMSDDKYAIEVLVMNESEVK